MKARKRGSMMRDIGDFIGRVGKIFLTGFVLWVVVGNIGGQLDFWPAVGATYLGLLVIDAVKRGV